ncbi:sensor histidine kinase [Nocardia arthritidis]|uniref:histidine kinase n=1 Tax=Nocardia arthritidis TaxID=228602 RepID=A0A6G9Y6Q1_9NOCA|nr:HAMP domain-containing sensor histidine kinase [Nocardia arthritidis]QIS08757.1 HAMP domain-containing protein [Nocardia arthritidis]
MIRRWPIRIRLTAAFTIMMAVVLTVIGYATVAHMRSFLDTSVTESLTYQLTELRPVAAAVEPTLPGPSQDTAVQVLTADGHVVAATAELPGPSVLSDTELAAARRGTVIADHPAAADLPGPVRLAATSAPQDRIVVVVVSLADRDAAVADLARELVIAFPLVLVAAAVGAYALAVAALRPVERMRARAAGITHTDPAARLPIPAANDEISRLGITFNDQLARLYEAVDRERRFVADAGHELRTPLGLLTTELELALRRPRGNAELTDALRSALEETERLSRLARNMLSATAGRPRDPGSPLPVVDLPPLLDAVVARYGVAARDITVDCPPGARAAADSEDLDRIMTNLVDNAIEHGGPPVDIRVDTGGTAVIVTVRDHGPGIDAEFLPHAFERFARADAARTRGGSGLGLAIVTALAQRNAATITAANHPGGGFLVTVTLSAPR